MKKNTKKIGSILIAAAIAVSAVPAATYSVSAADVPEYEYEIRTNAAKADRSATVTITEEEIAKGDVTFSAAGYIVASDQLSADAYINNVAMAWEPIDAEGNSMYKYISFTNIQDKVNSIGPLTEYTLSDGSTISSEFNLHCLSVAHPRKGTIQTSSQWTQTLKTNLEDCIDGNTMYADGKGGCYFTRDVFGATAGSDGEIPKETIYPEVEYHEDTQTATLKFPYIEKSEKVEVEAVQEVFYYDPTLPAGTPIPGPNNLDYGAYSGTNGASKFLGATSDELPYTTFDVTVKAGTPAGVYYLAFDDERLNQVTASNWKAYDPSNIEVNYGENGIVLGYNRNDEENWLKIVVGDADATTKPTTTTTTATTTTTTATTTTTTATVSTTGPAVTTGTPSLDGYSWVAGEYWANPGDQVEIAPTVYNCPGDLMTIGFDFIEDPLIGSGAITLTEFGDTDGELGTAYPTFTNMYFHISALHAGGTDKNNGEKGVAAAEDGSTLGIMYVNVADKDTVVAAAEKLGLKLQKDDEHGTYYAFPLEFDQSIDPVKGAPKCEAVNVKEEYTEINFVNGSINIIVGEAFTTTATTATTTSTTTTTTTTTTATTGSKTTTATTTTTSKTTTTGDPNWNDLIGDTNLDGRVGVQDIIRLNKYLVGSADLNEQAKRNAACKDDGVIDAKDLTSLMRYLVNLIDALPEA